MKVFISWSGEQSKAIANTLKEWLPSVIQAVKPFVSSHDITTGSLWMRTITKELAVTDTGVLCMNAENIEAPWILFEAGALSKGLEENAVTAILFGIQPSALKPPLSHFQNTPFTKEGIWKLVCDTNTRLKDNSLSDPILKKIFESFWPELEKSIGDIQLKIKLNAKPKRDQADMLEEILELCRSQARATPFTGFSSVAASDRAVNDFANMGQYAAFSAGQYKFPPVSLGATSCQGCGNISHDLRRCQHCNKLVCANCSNRVVTSTQRCEHLL
jgi:hypothetical protein